VGSIAKYWTLIRLDAAGNRRTEEIVQAKLFFRQQFPNLDDQADTTDATIQRQIWHILHGETIALRDAAEQCLRCYISHQIVQACLNLAYKFGHFHRFTDDDLYPFVLDDDGKPLSHRSERPYQFLASRVLQTFDPERGSLNAWVRQYVKQQPDLCKFLLQQGVYLLTDWAILNDTPPERLTSLLAKFHQLTPIEIQHAHDLLVSYHAIYLEDRLQQSVGKAPCQPPTQEQLNRIAQHLHPLVISPDSILKQLQTIARFVRQHRIASKGGSLPVESLDDPDQPFIEPATDVTDDEDHVEFLEFYRNQLQFCLDQAIAAVTRDRLTTLQQKNPSKDRLFFTALYLFHCQGQSMSSIAPQVGLSRQDEVTRLLKLNDFRADIRRRLLVLLSPRIIDKAKRYLEPQQLAILDQQLETLLDQQIGDMIAEAEAEAKTRTRRQSSLLAKRICQFLDTSGGIDYE
jgi:hypothetical protein